jgi:hypothetical protein
VTSSVQTVKLWLKIVSVWVVPLQTTQTKHAESLQNCQQKLTSSISKTAGKLDLSCGTRQQILNKNLNMWQISTNFVPQLCADKQKLKQFLVTKNMAVVLHLPSFVA